MSTRSTTHFRDVGAERPAAIVYRHSDGYPEGHGADLAAFLDEAGKLPDPRFGDPTYLAAKLVVWLARRFATRYDPDTQTWAPTGYLDFLSVGVCTADPGDIEYRYVMECGPGRPTVTTWHGYGDEWQEVAG